MKIASGYNNGRLTLYLEGELDHHSARAAMKAIEQEIQDTLSKECVLDMAGLSFMDSSGIALILKAHKIVKAQGGRVWIEHPSRQATRVLETSGIERIVPIAQET